MPFHIQTRMTIQPNSRHKAKSHLIVPTSLMELEIPNTLCLKKHVYITSVMIKYNRSFYFVLHNAFSLYIRLVQIPSTTLCLLVIDNTFTSIIWFASAKYMYGMSS